ncbi:MAG: bifunctional diaminohydroxyphosphoribosylaminopyrimidine deaminase/5-amino-6-(5-phosphoribosylamino)uracil reductase RibD [Actinomycetales bacterium]|nr:bifunctional diaminohydroxyphosphoribosylaminopyrimidine deaminase/5-amino-6-(5-phosphoribosylamino)uracil reductase RibD [Actinomycetales bacterium]
MATTAETEAMRLAFAAAREAVNTLPNPQVGCVVLDADENVIALGHHHGAGQPHAEIEALNQAGERTRGATAVVTLEPCKHTGRTGPCAEALIAAGVRRVVFAASDPNAQGAGGAEVLRAAGVDVEAGLLAAEGEQLIEVWAHLHRTGRPFVTWKFAAGIDGRSAAADGTSQWITSAESRADVHRLRAECDAILIGTGTALADNPRLTIRNEFNELAAQQPLRVVVGESEIPRSFNLHSSEAPTMFLSQRDPIAVLAELSEIPIHHVWLEGGPTLAGAWLDAGVVDRVIGYLAPTVVGSGLAAVTTSSPTLSDQPRFDYREVSQIGPDLRVTLGPKAPEPTTGEGL